MTRLARVLGPAAAATYRAYHRTLRLTGVLPDGSRIDPYAYPFRNEIFAVCERDLLLLMGLAAARAMIVLVAPGRDGDWGAAIATAMGCTVVRGSSRHRAAAALAELSALARQDAPMFIVVDGPSGPAGIAKAGAIALASATGRPVRALSCAAYPSIRIPGTWSGMYLPLPFARGLIVASDTWRIEGATARDDRVERAAALSETLRVQRLRAELALR